MHFTTHVVKQCNFSTTKKVIIIHCLSLSMVERIIKDIYLLWENIFYNFKLKKNVRVHA